MRHHFIVANVEFMILELRSHNVRCQCCLDVHLFNSCRSQISFFRFLTPGVHMSYRVLQNGSSLCWHIINTMEQIYWFLRNAHITSQVETSVINVIKHTRNTSDFCKDKIMIWIHNCYSWYTVTKKDIIMMSILHFCTGMKYMILHYRGSSACWI